jgi:glycosyltransferase involved in cell wall biosynthesis
MAMKISCVVPVYNNSQTIRHVLTVLNDNPNIDELVIIDDKSKDDSLAIIEDTIRGKQKVTFLRNERNLGKGGAVVKALRQTRNEVVFLCDADLSTLKQEHVNYLVDTYLTGTYDMVIGATDNAFEGRNLWDKFLSTVSGERILKKSAIEPYYELIASMGNGIEQITNFAHKDKDVKIISLVGTGHVLKFQRDVSRREWISAYLKEGRQLVSTDMKIKKQMVTKEIRVERLLRGLAVGSLAAGLFSLWFFSTKHNRKPRK